MVAFLRYCFMNPADPREVDIPGSFFLSTPPPLWKPSQWGHYPLHWFSHVMHCFEIIGRCHPDSEVAGMAMEIYYRMVASLHLNPEGRLEMFNRLDEDRIANGTVVT